MNQIRIRQVHARLQKIYCFICASLVKISTHSLPQIAFAAFSCQQATANGQPDSSSLVRSVLHTDCREPMSPTDAASTSLDNHGTRTHRPRHLFSWLLSSTVKLVTTMRSGSDRPSNTPTDCCWRLIFPAYPSRACQGSRWLATPKFGSVKWGKQYRPAKHSPQTTPYTDDEKSSERQSQWEQAKSFTSSPMSWSLTNWPWNNSWSRPG